MKCKKGDIARITHSQNGINDHRLVRCEFVDDMSAEHIMWGVTTLQTVFNFDTDQYDPPGSHGLCADHLLEPLPGISEDEVMTLYAPFERDTAKA